MENLIIKTKKFSVEGFTVQQPKDILELKLRLNMEKDIIDIKIIKEFINE